MSFASGAAVEEFLEGGSAEELLAWRAARVDALVCEAFAEHLAPVMQKGVSLLAVGGYGRRQLFPYSDVDLLVLCENELPEAVRQSALPAFLQSLWDRDCGPAIRCIPCASAARCMSRTWNSPSACWTSDA